MSDKPSWLQLHEQAEATMRLARVEKAAASQMRCKSEDTRGEQCTADYFPPDHEHVYAADEAEDGF